MNDEQNMPQGTDAPADDTTQAPAADGGSEAPAAEGESTEETPAA